MDTLTRESFIIDLEWFLKNSLVRNRKNQENKLLKKLQKAKVTTRHKETRDLIKKKIKG